MKPMFKKVWMKALVFTLAASLSLPAIAQEDEMKDLPGYFDFGQLNSMFGEPTVQIAVGGSLLRMVGALGAKEEPEAAALFNRLKGVRVSVFETDVMADGAVDFVKDVSSQLSAANWESVVTVNSEDEQVRIFMKINEDEIEGITVMALESTEAVFINVIGNLDPAELSEVMDNFDIDLGGDDDDENEA